MPALTLLKLLGVLVAAAVLCAGVLLPYVGGVGLVASQQATKFLNQTCNLQETPPPQKTTLYASDGTTVLATIFKQDRDPVPLTQVPDVLQQALIATEDRRFYKHHGVDMRGLIRSAFSTSNGDTQGGSTLTMQYVKQERYYQAGDDLAKQEAAIAQNLQRKIEDAKCALEIEKKESKDQILDNYLNIAFFGENSYGIQTAAQTYFDKPVSKLDLAQSAMLVGLLKAPSQYDPFGNGGQNAKDTIARRNEVIQNLVDVGDLSAAAGKTWQAKPLELASRTAPAVQEGCPATIGNVKVTNAGFFCDYVTNWLADTAGLSATQVDEGGLKIVTTLDVAKQNQAQAALDVISPKSPTTAIMPEIDPKTGDILAMATSKQYGLTNDGGHTTVPVFTQDITGGASTFKLFPLLAALSTGASPTLEIGSNVTDAQGLVYQPTNCGDPSYKVHNSTPNGFDPNETLTTAIAKSSNTYFVALEDQFFAACDMSPYVNVALKLGMNSLNDRIASGNAPTVASVITDQQRANFTLGAYNTNPLEVTGAYAAVANDGKYCPPVPVKSITDANNKPIQFKHAPCTQAVTPQVARYAAKLLTGDSNQPIGTSVAQFQGWYAQHPTDLIASKTGTNNASTPAGVQLPTNSSLWFAGMTPNIAATTALININHPQAPLAGLPGMTDAQAGGLYGEYAAQYWLSALNPTLQAQGDWTWPDPTLSDGTQQGVPAVVGQPVDVATATLKAANFKVSVLNNGQPYCAPPNGAGVPPGAVAYQSATLADPGATISLCVATPVPLQIYVKPLPPPPPPPPPNPSSGARTSPGNNTPGGGASTGAGRSRPGGGTPPTNRVSPPR